MELLACRFGRPSETPRPSGLGKQRRSASANRPRGLALAAGASYASQRKNSILLYTVLFTAATTPRPLAHHALGDLYDQDSVVGSDGFDGMNDEGDSDCLDY
jgi:hypothetical protein